jgi:chromate reductase
MKVLAISGSLRRDSNNTRLLRALAAETRDGVELELWDGLKEIPAFDQDDEADPPASVQAFKDAVADADAVLIATPEYNHSIPGSLKNALDWASRPLGGDTPFRGKPVAVIASSAGMFGGVWASAELRKVLGAMGARVTDVELAVPHAHEKFDEGGTLIEEELRAGLNTALATLVDAQPELAAA